jgi:hypothetical protein
MTFEMEELLEKYKARIQELYPQTPEYVVDEFIENNIEGQEGVIKKIENTYFGDIKPELRGYNDWFLKGPWELRVLDLGWEDFDVTTQQAFVDRQFGEVNSYQVPNDKERLEYQKARAKGDGRNEPVILHKTPKGYILLEGWHRVMATLLLGNNGDHPDTWPSQKIRAWIHS